MYATLINPCFTASAPACQGVNDNAARHRKLAEIHALLADIARHPSLGDAEPKSLPGDLNATLEAWMAKRAGEGFQQLDGAAA